MKIILRTPEGWSAPVDNQSAQTCDRDGAKLWIGPTRKEPYCDRVHEAEKRYTMHDKDNPEEDAWDGETFTLDEARDELATMFFYDWDPEQDGEGRNPDDVPLDDFLIGSHIELRDATTGEVYQPQPVTE